MPKGPLRRAQIISPFGIGSMVVTRDGIGVIECGVDHWFESESGQTTIDLKEFKHEEWRLQKYLGVNHFRTPPDWRYSKSSEDIPNQKLTIPFLRFPTWNYCNFCGTMERSTDTNRVKLFCKQCNSKNRKSPIVQVPFVAICERGHIQDFPFREWVHKSSSPTCNRSMKISGVGMATLNNVIVSCECSLSRPLSGVLDEDNGRTNLSNRLEQNGEYLCNGSRPWLRDQDPEICNNQIKGSMRSAANVYYGNTTTAIYIPRGNTKSIQELVEIFGSDSVAQVVLHYESHKPVDEIIRALKSRNELNDKLSIYDDDSLRIAINTKLKNEANPNEEDVPENDDEFKLMEYEALSKNQNSYDLKVESIPLSKYSNSKLNTYFSKIHLIDRLRETRVFTGFSRIRPNNNQTVEQGMRQIFKNPPEQNKSWLPCNIIYGEGIFFELNELKLKEWEKLEVVKARTKAIVRNMNIYLSTKGRPTFEEEDFPARYFLLHTLSHLLLNQVTFDCGYSTGSLKERLYSSMSNEFDMKGLLIYTAAGDSEGTMGGLVKMGIPGTFEELFSRTISNARWCSSDPVCMELGKTGGQGPNSCNLAACHNCCLVPENACELFNQYLDRAFVIGSLDNPELGYFNDYE